ncbi:MAG TPA: hypothetical protein PK957_00785 [Candidatus Dojkabacteria bacterium]|nr:hypothetical protein [Candidatus Dojkabacteria bacterium]
MDKTAQIVQSISLTDKQKNDLISLIDSVPEELKKTLLDEFGDTVSVLDQEVLQSLSDFKNKILKRIAFYQGMILASKDITNERKEELVAESLEWKKTIIEGIDNLLNERTN